MFSRKSSENSERLKFVSDAPKRSHFTKFSKCCLTFGRVELLSILALIVVLLVVTVFIAFKETHTHAKGNAKTLGDGLPTSFSAKFETYLYETSEWIKQDENIMIEMDNKGLRYREVSSISNENAFSSERIITTALGNEAFFGVQIGANETYSCHDYAQIDFIPVIRAIENATKVKPSEKKVYLSSCSSSELWSYSLSEGDVIYFCFRSGKLVDITQGELQARVLSWNTPATKQITRPLSNKCLPKKIPRKQNSKTKTVRKPKTKTKLPNRKCFFIHGAGEKPDKTCIYNGSFEHYWGKVIDFTPRCISRTFVHMDTVSNGWDSPELQKIVCNIAANNTTKVISDYMIFTHSMGNLILAAALHNNVCTFNKSSSEWYSVQGPWKGSKIANGLVRVCKHRKIVQIAKTIAGLVNIDIHYCHKGNPASAYTSLATDYKSSTGVTYHDLFITARRFVSGALCGISSYGMGLEKKESVGLFIISKFFHLETPDDGMVAYESCKIFEDMEGTYESRFYAGHINHSEGRCRDGEKRKRWSTGNSGMDRKPCSWYKEL